MWSKQDHLFSQCTHQSTQMNFFNKHVQDCENLFPDLNAEISKYFSWSLQLYLACKTKSLINYNLSVFSKSIIDFWFFCILQHFCVWRGPQNEKPSRNNSYSTGIILCHISRYWKIINFTNCPTWLFCNKYIHKHTFAVTWSNFKELGIHAL